MRRALIGAVVAGAMSIAACADLFGFKDLTEGAGPDVSVPDSGADVDTCAHARWPDPPATSESGTPKDYTVAVHHVHFTTDPDGGTTTFGYDLDGRCTTLDGGASCTGPLTADGVGGIDNQTIALMNTLISLQPSLASSLGDNAVNLTLEEGTFTILVRIFALQSDQNQSSITGLKVAVQASPGITNGPPTWDGGDRWHVADDNVAGGIEAGTNYPTANVFFSQTYVSNGVLVASNPTAITLDLYLAPPNTLTGPLRVVLNDPVLTARLVKRGDGQYDLADGLVVGRWSTTDMLHAIGDLTVSGSSLCSTLGGAVYQIVQQQICAARDITSDGVDNFSKPCDAISVALGFDGVAASVTNTPTVFPKPTTPCTIDAALCN